MTTASIIEIFSSIQGEGPYVGERHLFVRFEGCSLTCKFCDTPASFVHNARCRVEARPLTKEFTHYDNPLTVSKLNGLLEFFSKEKTLSVTGGEPLESLAFLKVWLPTLENRYQVLLETAGIHYRALEEIIPWVDIISMDLKLPSVTGMQPYWEEHRRFATIAMEKDLYVKVIVSAETSDADFDEAITTVASLDEKIPFIIQPATPFAQFRATPRPEQLLQWQGCGNRYLHDVRIIPQLHKELKVL